MSAPASDNAPLRPERGRTWRGWTWRGGVPRRWVRWTGVAIGVVVLLWLGLCYQVVQNPPLTAHPAAADAIVVLGPASDARTDTAIALAEQNPSHTMVISSPGYEGRSAQLCARPPDGWTVYCFVPVPDTTRGEAEYLQDLAATHHWSTFTVVTSRFHISRAHLILKRCLSGQVQMVAASESVGFMGWLYQYVYQSAGYVRVALHQAC